MTTWIFKLHWPSPDGQSIKPKIFGLSKSGQGNRSASSERALQKPPPAAPSATHSPFDGPLPFESLNLGKSIFGKKKDKSAIEDDAGGFEKASTGQEKPAQPLPPWFSEQVSKDKTPQHAFEDRLNQIENYDSGDGGLGTESILRRQETGEVIELDEPVSKTHEVIAVDSSSEDGVEEVHMEDALPADSELRMDDVADVIRAEPPVSEIPSDIWPKEHGSDPKSGHFPAPSASTIALEVELDGEEEPLEWEDSDQEEQSANKTQPTEAVRPAGGDLQEIDSKSPSPEFENVGIPDSPTAPQHNQTNLMDDTTSIPSLQRDASFDQKPYEDLPNPEDEDAYSDPEDDELMRQLAVEAEEHARFASTLNAKSQLQNAEDYEP